MRTIRELLPDRPVTGVDVGCGTGRYSKLLLRPVPKGSLLIASDVAAAMLAKLQAGNRGPGLVAALRSTAEELSVRSDSLDLVTSFNSVHHFDLGRFLAGVAACFGRVANCSSTPAPRSRTRAPIVGAVLPRLHRPANGAYTAGGTLAAIDRTRGLVVEGHSRLPLPALKHPRAAQGPGRGAPLLGRSACTPRTSWPRPSSRSSLACRPRGALGGQSLPAGRRRTPPGADPAAEGIPVP